MNDFIVTIVGTGVIGSSIGLALKQQKDPPQLLAHDKELATAQAAVKAGAFDKAEWNLINACEPADLIILAIPLNGFRPTLEAISPYLKEGVVLSDTIRSKVPPLKWAQELLPDHAHFIGGNPMVHPLKRGYQHAMANLFQDRLYCLTPAASADEEAVQLMVGFIHMLGADPFFLDATEHDGLMAAVEYLPAFLGISLLSLLTQQPSWREMRKMAGRLFEQSSSGVGEDPEAVLEELLNNRENLLLWLDQYLTELHRMRTLLAEADSEPEPLQQQLEQLIIERQKWLADYQESHFVDPELKGPEIDPPSFMKRLIGFGR